MLCEMSRMAVLPKQLVQSRFPTHCNRMQVIGLTRAHAVTNLALQTLQLLTAFTGASSSMTSDNLGIEAEIYEST